MDSRLQTYEEEPTKVMVQQIRLASLARWGTFGLFVLGIFAAIIYTIWFASTGQITGSIIAWYFLVMPPMYAVAGLISCMIFGVIYNSVANRVGGIQVDIVTQIKPLPPPPPERWEGTLPKINDSRGVELKYSLGTTDLLTFNQHFLSTKGVPGLRREALINAATTFCLFVLLMYFAVRTLDAALVVAGLVAAVVGIAWPSVRTNQIMKAIPKAIARQHDGKGPDGVLGSHVLKIGSEGVIDQTAVSETRHAWSGVREIHVTGSHLYLLIRPSVAFIVPRQAVGDVEDLLQQLAGYVGESAIRRFDQRAA